MEGRTQTMRDFEIRTERLVLKPLGTQYLASTIEYAMNLENTKYMCNLPDETVEEAERFLLSVENEWKKERPNSWEFAILYQGEHIGAVSVYFENDTGELGWILNRKYWGNGFAVEAAGALVEYVKRERPVSRLIAHCDTENIASYQVMEKLGMVRTGEWGGRRNRSAAQDSSEYQYELYMRNAEECAHQNLNRP